MKIHLWDLFCMCKPHCMYKCGYEFNAALGFSTKIMCSDFKLWLQDWWFNMFHACMAVVLWCHNWRLHDWLVCQPQISVGCNVSCLTWLRNVSVSRKAKPSWENNPVTGTHMWEMPWSLSVVRCQLSVLAYERSADIYRLFISHNIIGCQPKILVLSLSNHFHLTEKQMCYN